MKRTFFLFLSILATSSLLVSCIIEDDHDDDNNEEKFRKIDYVLGGPTLNTTVLSEDYTWVGEQLRKINFGVDSSAKIEYTYYDETSTKIKEIIYTGLRFPKSVFHNAIVKSINKYLPQLNKDLPPFYKITPIYEGNRVKQVEVSFNLTSVTPPQWYPFIRLDYYYTNNYPTKINVSLVAHFSENIAEIYLVWDNGNLVTFYIREREDGRFITMDSLVFTYDNKPNAFGSLSYVPIVPIVPIVSIDPILPELHVIRNNCRNNIVSGKMYSFDGPTNEPNLDGDFTITYTYDSQNYPTEAVITETTSHETWVEKYFYKPE